MSKNGSTYHRLLNSSEWRELRARQLDLHPFCEDCGKLGILEPATEVHHLRPVESVPEGAARRALCYDKDNVVSLCHRCHAERHKALKSHSVETAQARAKAEAAAFWQRFS